MSTFLKDFEHERGQILAKLSHLNKAHHMPLSAEEKMASEAWEKMKQEIKGDPSIRLLAELQHNFNTFSKTRLFHAIRAMPKGVLQHCHLPSTINITDFVDVFTHHPQVYFSPKARSFALHRPESPLDLQEYIPILEYRKKRGDHAVEDEIRNIMLMNDGEMRDKNTATIFAHFNTRFGIMGDCFFFEPVLKAFIQRCVGALKEDNILGAEVRNVTLFLIKEDLKQGTREEELTFYKQMKKEATEGGLALNWIHTGVKEKEKKPESVTKWLEVAGIAYDNPLFKDVFSGVDMVDYEGNFLLYDMRKELIEFKQKHPEAELILHAGESISKRNHNVLDAVLLGSKRLGHGIHLAYNPSLIELVKQRNVCVEVNVVSNFILAFMRDPFWHPLRMMLNEGVPCALSSDDCLFWDVLPLTMDFFVATVYCDLSLAEVKLLIANSIDYSYFPSAQKEALRKEQAAKWSEWVAKLTLN